MENPYEFDFPEETTNTPLVKETTTYGSPRRRKTSPMEALHDIRSGMEVGEYDTVQHMLGISCERLGDLTGMTRSTLHRRRKEGRLTKEESDRLFRFGRLYFLAEKVLGSGEAARKWLKDEATGLGGMTPLDCADTEAGAREVEALLWRIELGVYH